MPINPRVSRSEEFPDEHDRRCICGGAGWDGCDPHHPPVFSNQLVRQAMVSGDQPVQRQITIAVRIDDAFGLGRRFAELRAASPFGHIARNELEVCRVRPAS